MKFFLLQILLCFLVVQNISAQNFTFNFGTTGKRVCLVSSEVDQVNETVKIIFHDSLSNTTQPLFVNRRLKGTYTWNNVVSSLSAGTGHWIDTNVNQGEVWEYQVKRQNTWTFLGNNYDATGYTMGAVMKDNSDYKGQMILLVVNDIQSNLNTKYNRLKKELVADGWFVNELIVPKATSWDSGMEVVTIKNQIVNIYNTAPASDKPKVLFILGHVPMPRSGSTAVVAPDEHDENKGARGCDAYYADIDGVYTDLATYDPGGLVTPLATNLPGDYKWDQDFFPSDVEMAFGRIDFEDINDVSLSELQMTENYLDRLSNYKNVASGFDMGNKSGFYFGYDNSNDGSFRTLVNISKPSDVYQNNTGPNHNQWVQNNGPFKVYMQNLLVPSISDWQTYGMNATVFSSDQSYWGFGDVPQPGGSYSRIRALLGVESKCLATLWTTTGINIFHQACSGEPVGISMKTIMNHNTSNNYLEKPQQSFDTQDWWNRTHFAFHGDPTISLYQVKAPTNLTLAEVGGEAKLNWDLSTDPEVIGYHVYESTSEFGIFEKISTILVNEGSYIIDDYQNGNWYMVKAIKDYESGCGKFLQSSLGIDLQANLVLSSINQDKLNNLNIYPNPSSDFMQVNAEEEIVSYTIMDAKGSSVLEKFENKASFSIDISSLPEGVYLLKLQTSSGTIHFEKILKRNG